MHWYESTIDRQLREAQERGEFENLKGAGKPLDGYGQEYEEDWWVKDWLRREGATAGALPPTLAVRREAEDLDDIAGRLWTEREVRDKVAELNARIHDANNGRLSGPGVLVRPFDAEAVVQRWRARRGRGGARG